MGTTELCYCFPCAVESEFHVGFCSVSNGLMGGWGLESASLKPRGFFAPLSPASATRSIKARLTERQASSRASPDGNAMLPGGNDKLEATTSWKLIPL